MSDAGRIVIIDDSWIVLERVKASLGAHGYDVRTATGAAGAGVHVKTCDLAIVDFHLPGANGGEILAELRRGLPIGAKCLFYLYTSDPEVATQYAKHGFDGSFLRKGDEKALVPQVDAVFRTVKMRKLAEKMRDFRKG